MSKKLKELEALTIELSKVPIKELFLYAIEYAYDNGYEVDKLLELYKNYLKGEK